MNFANMHRGSGASESAKYLCTRQVRKYKVTLISLNACSSSLCKRLSATSQVVHIIWTGLTWWRGSNSWQMLFQCSCAKTPGGDKHLCIPFSFEYKVASSCRFYISCLRKLFSLLCTAIIRRGLEAGNKIPEVNLHVEWDCCLNKMIPQKNEALNPVIKKNPPPPREPPVDTQVDPWHIWDPSVG